MALAEASVVIIVVAAMQAAVVMAETVALAEASVVTIVVAVVLAAAVVVAMTHERGLDKMISVFKRRGRPIRS